MQTGIPPSAGSEQRQRQRSASAATAKTSLSFAWRTLGTGEYLNGKGTNKSRTPDMGKLKDPRLREREKLSTGRVAMMARAKKREKGRGKQGKEFFAVVEKCAKEISILCQRQSRLTARGRSRCFGTNVFGLDSG